MRFTCSQIVPWSTLIRAQFPFNATAFLHFSYTPPHFYSLKHFRHMCSSDIMIIFIMEKSQSGLRLNTANWFSKSRKSRQNFPKLNELESECLSVASCWIICFSAGSLSHLVVTSSAQLETRPSHRSAGRRVCHTYKSMCHTFLCCVLDGKFTIYHCGELSFLWGTTYQKCCTIQSNSVAHLFWKQCATLLWSSVPLCVFLMCTISSAV